MANLRQIVQQKQTQQPPDLGPTVTVTGVTVGSPAELFVWNALLQLATRNRWGTEADLVTQIGRPTVRPPAPAPVGLVTVRTDGQGNATASLLAAGPVPPQPVFPNRQTAETALKALGFATGSRWLSDLDP